MKKFLSMILALALVVALAVPAFAAEINENKGTGEQEVTAQYVAPQELDGGKVYRIVIEWAPTEEETALSYTGKNSTYTWDTSSLQYKETVNNAEQIGWAGAAGYKVTVTNYSNDDIATTTTATNNYGLALAEPEAKEATLESAAKGIDFNDTEATGEETAAEFTYTYSADENAAAPTGAENATITVGKITVEIAAAD